MRRCVRARPHTPAAIPLGLPPVLAKASMLVRYCAHRDAARTHNHNRHTPTGHF
jgi:hypothetical protein